MNILLLKELERIETELDITKYQLLKISEAFQKDMKGKKTLKMLHTYIFANTGETSGEYLAVDFGGTNVRIFLYEFYDKNKVRVKKSTSFKLKDNNRDLTSGDYTLFDVFYIIAGEIEKITDKKKKYLLGLTFSFQIDSYSKNRAILLSFSKGFNLREAIGKDVNEIFKDALEKRNLMVEPISVINDTTATFLSGSFYEKNVEMAIIVGTGHNICFRNHDGELINMEAGCFNNELPLSFYDLKHIENNPKTKESVMELLTGGKYIGETAAYIVDYLNEKGLLALKKSIDGKVLTDSLTNKLDDTFSEEEKEVIAYIAEILLKRGAKLVVAEIIAILNEIDPNLSEEHTIIFDGSVYEKNEYFRENIGIYLEKYYMKNAKKIKHIFIKDASVLGAALSALSFN